MSTNRLFIFDPDTNKAICLAKGYSTGWLTGIGYIDDWFDENQEYTGAIDKTRFTLITEMDIPKGCSITYEDDKA